MQIAFGITQFDYVDEITEDPTYGELKLVYKKWGDGPTGTRLEPIERRPCTAEELGLGP